MGIKNPGGLSLDSNRRQMPPKLARLMKSRTFSGGPSALTPTMTTALSSPVPAPQLPRKPRLSQAKMKRILLVMLLAVFVVYVLATSFVALRQMQRQDRAVLWKRRQERLHLEPSTMLLQHQTDLATHLREQQPVDGTSVLPERGNGDGRTVKSQKQQRRNGHIERINKVSSASKDLEVVELDMRHPKSKDDKQKETIREVYKDRA